MALVYWILFAIVNLAILLVVLAPAMALGSLFVRLTCILFNKIALSMGSSGTVPISSFWTGVKINVISGMANVCLFILLVIISLFAGEGDAGLAIMPFFLLLAVIVAFLIFAGAVTTELPTNFAKGVLFALLYGGMIVGLFVLAMVLAVTSGTMIFGAGGAIL